MVAPFLFVRSIGVEIRAASMMVDAKIYFQMWQTEGAINSGYNDLVTTVQFYSKSLF